MAPPITQMPDVRLESRTYCEVTPESAEEFLRLEALASAPYTQFVFGDPDTARAVQERLFHAGVAEFAPPHGRLALIDGHVVGMFAALTGSELQKRRLQSSLTLGGSLRDDAGPRLRERIRLAARTLLKVRPDDYYLSRIAVASDARGLGIGRWMLEQVEQAARDRGCPRLVLEVSPVHARAERMYRDAGFEQIDACSVTCPDTGRSLQYRHLEKRFSVRAPA